jgi:hypothetical protein
MIFASVFGLASLSLRDGAPKNTILSTALIRLWFLRAGKFAGFMSTLL